MMKYSQFSKNFLENPVDSGGVFLTELISGQQHFPAKFDIL